MNKENFQKLAGILLEKKDSTFSEQDKALLQKYVSWLRAIYLWFHGAHHVVQGPSFAGDHATLYDKIYTEVEKEIDGAAEKVIGLVDDKHLACPMDITQQALAIMEKYESPSMLSARQIAEAGLQIEKDYIEFVEELFKHLESKQLLSLGLGDQLGASVNTHETYVYLLQQRAK